MIVFTGISFYLYGQGGDHKNFKKADKTFYQEQLSQALIEYNEIGKTKEFSERALYNMEICSLLTDHPNKPLDEFFKYKREAKEDKFYYYWLGRIYYAKSEFAKAEQAWKSFQQVRVYKSKEIIEETKHFIEIAQRAKRFYQDVGDYKVVSLPENINSPQKELGPVFYEPNSELLFLSDRGSQDGSTYEIYKATKKAQGWSKAKVDDNFGTFEPGHAEIRLAGGDNSIFYFKGSHKLDFYSSTVKKNKWEKPEVVVEKTGMKRFEGHFCINKNHDMIIFSMRRRDAPNDKDLFVIKKESEDNWSKAALLSENLVSLEDEDYPYLSDDGQTLYFSSMGFDAVGGYDIFKSTLSNGEWTKPEQLKFPINTIDNDIGFKPLSSMDEGYLVSNRPGSLGETDIYYFSKLDVMRMIADIKDEGKLPVKDIIIRIKDKSGQIILDNFHADDDGNFETVLYANQNYMVTLTHLDQELLNEEITVPAPENGKLSFAKSFSIAPKRMKTDGEEFAQDLIDPKFEELDKIGSKFRLTNKAVIRNIYFDFDRYLLKPEDKQKLDPLVASLKENPGVDIEVAGHTDNIGGEEQNLRISQLRASSVKNYLVENGIDESRIEAKGYGESSPLASNDDEKDGRELNRRIEIVIKNEI